MLTKVLINTRYNVGYNICITSAKISNFNYNEYVDILIDMFNNQILGKWINLSP
jgi:hypothetical protein